MHAEWLFPEEVEGLAFLNLRISTAIPAAVFKGMRCSGDSG
jgi:hypothetical protein